MQRAIKNYILEESDHLKDINLDKNYINKTFGMIEIEINRITKMEIKRAREKKLREWRKREKLNCGRNNKKLRRLRR